MHPPKLLVMSGIANISVDAYLTERNNELLFLSVWGCDVAIQELLARMTLKEAEKGIRSFDLYDRGVIVANITVPAVSKLDKLTGRAPKGGLLGGFTQAWIFQKQLVEPDRRARCASLIALSGDALETWSVIKGLSPYPLLDHWRDPVMDFLCASEQLLSLKGFHVQGRQIRLDNDLLGEFLSEQLRSGQLTVAPASQAKAA